MTTSKPYHAPLARESSTLLPRARISAKLGSAGTGALDSASRAANSPFRQVSRGEAPGREIIRPLRRQEAEAQREKLQRDDHQHAYFVREQPSGECEVVRANIPGPTSHYVVARRGAASVTTDAEQTAELADAARRLKALRERRARLANVPSEPEPPPPYVVPPPLPGLRGY